MTARILGDLNVEEGDREPRVERVDIATQHARVIGRGGGMRRNQLRAQRTHFLIKRPEPDIAPVGQRGVVLVHAGKRRVHRTPLVVVREEPIQNVAHRSSGMETHRRSRNDFSTALINSCTCAPSSKFPSFSGPSLRISVMKELTRFA